MPAGPLACLPASLPAGVQATPRNPLLKFGEALGLGSPSSQVGMCTVACRAAGPPAAAAAARQAGWARMRRSAHPPPPPAPAQPPLGKAAGTARSPAGPQRQQGGCLVSLQGGRGCVQMIRPWLPGLAARLSWAWLCHGARLWPFNRAFNTGPFCFLCPTWTPPPTSVAAPAFNCPRRTLTPQSRPQTLGCPSATGQRCASPGGAAAGRGLRQHHAPSSRL